MEDFVPPEKSDSLRAQGGAVVSGLRSAVLQSTRHFEALAQLLQFELQEYGSIQMKRIALIAVGSVLLVVAYAFFCLAAIIACKLLWGESGMYLSIGIVVLFNMLVGLLLLGIGLKRKPAGIAPATCRELKDDLQCVKLYLKGKEKS